MMLRGLSVSLLFAVLAAPAYAQDSTQESGQTNPNTTQTDESEDDWRKSRKKRDSGDIFKDIVTNPNSQGTGGVWGGETKAIDRLNPESRRHLNRQRAKALAEATPGEPIDAAYEPSAEAKTDEYIAKQEANAWKEMVEEANSGLGGIGGDAQGSGQGASGQGQSGQSGQQSAGQGQSSGQAGQAGQGQSESRNSPLRGGSANSASDILNQIKGRGTVPTGAAGSGSAPTGQTAGQQAGQAPSGQPSGQQAGQSQTEGQSSNQRQSSNEGEAQSQAEQSAQGEAQADAQSKAEAAAKAQADAASKAASDAQAAAETAAQAAAHAETISPLERLKRDPVERAGTGGRTSASDYLNRKKD